MKSNVRPLIAKRKTTCVLTVSLLVSNRKDTIRKCLDSLQPLLNAIPSELIVVDTVGEEDSDGSLAIAKEYTDHIVQHLWDKDFAAARQTGMSAAGGEWFMFLDDDEWFENVDELVAFFKSPESKKFNALSYRVRSYLDEQGITYTDTYVSRTARLFPESHFEGKVHETIKPWLGPVKTVESFAHHYGYVFKNKESKEEHSERNVSLLMSDIEKDPENVRNYMQLSNEWLAIGKLEDAEKVARRGLACKDIGTYAAYANFMMTVIVRSRIARSDNDGAYQAAKEMLEEYAPYELGRAALYSDLANVARNLGKHEEALEAFDEYFKLEQQLRRDRQLYENQIMMDLPAYVREDRRIQNIVSATASAQILNNHEKMLEYMMLLPWKPGDGYIPGVIGGFIDAACLTGDKESLQYVCNRLEEDGRLPVYFQTAVNTVKGIHPEKTTEICALLAEIETDDPFFLIQKPLSVKDQDNEALEVALQACIDHELDCAVPRQELLTLCLEKDYDPSAFIAPLYMEDWIGSVDAILTGVDAEQLQYFMEKAELVLKPIDLGKYLYFTMSAQKFLLNSPALAEEELWPQMQRWSSSILDYSRHIYRDELFEQELCALPREVRCALSLKEASEAEEAGNMVGYFSGLRKALKDYPPMKEKIQILLELYQGNAEKKERIIEMSDRKEQIEFHDLALRVKERIVIMLENNQYVEAKPMLAQLQQLLPNDIQVREMSKQAGLFTLEGI